MIDNEVTHSLCVLAALANTTLGKGAAETKVTDHHLAILVYQNVGRFKVAVDHIAAVQKFQSAEGIVDDCLDVILVQATL